MFFPPILKFRVFFFFCGVYSQPSVWASLDSLALGNDVMQQQLDSISQGKGKHPALKKKKKKKRYFGSSLNLVQRLQEVFKKKKKLRTN